MAKKVTIDGKETFEYTDAEYDDAWAKAFEEKKKEVLERIEDEDKYEYINDLNIDSMPDVEVNFEYRGRTIYTTVCLGDILNEDDIIQNIDLENLIDESDSDEIEGAEDDYAESEADEYADEHWMDYLTIEEDEPVHPLPVRLCEPTEGIKMMWIAHKVGMTAELIKAILSAYIYTVNKNAQ